MRAGNVDAAMFLMCVVSAGDAVAPRSDAERNPMTVSGTSGRSDSNSTVFSVAPKGWPSPLMGFSRPSPAKTTSFCAADRNSIARRLGTTAVVENFDTAGGWWEVPRTLRYAFVLSFMHWLVCWDSTFAVVSLSNVCLGRPRSAQGSSANAPSQ